MHVFATELAVAKRDLAVGKCKKRMVFAQADIVARVPLGAALTHDDVAGANHLAAELLHAEALALAVTAVAGRAACFLMCHRWLLLLRRFLGCALSRRSIFCRGDFALGRSFLGRLLGTGGFVVLGRGALGRRADDFAGLMLGGGRVGNFLRTRRRRLVGLGRSFGLGRS